MSLHLWFSYTLLLRNDSCKGRQYSTGKEELQQKYSLDGAAFQVVMADNTAQGGRSCSGSSHWVVQPLVGSLAGGPAVLEAAVG